MIEEQTQTSYTNEPNEKSIDDTKPCYSVGCTGHIDLSRIVGFDEQAARMAIMTYFAKLTERYSVKLYCGMADGADMLFAESALACGAQLAAVLPCPWREYATEHADGGKFIRMLDMAAEVIIVPDSVQRYSGVLRCILQQSDEIVALCDGAEISLFDRNGDPINRGGTYDMLVTAKIEGKKVVLFN